MYEYMYDYLCICANVRVIYVLVVLVVLTLRLYGSTVGHRRWWWEVVRVLISGVSCFTLMYLCFGVLRMLCLYLYCRTNIKRTGTKNIKLCLRPGWANFAFGSLSSQCHPKWVHFVAFAPCDWKVMGKGRTTRPIHGGAWVEDDRPPGWGAIEESMNWPVGSNVDGWGGYLINCIRCVQWKCYKSSKPV